MHFLLFAVLLFSFNNVLWKKNIGKSSIEFLVAYRAVFTTFFSWGALFLILPEFSISSSDYLKITAGSILGTIGLFSMLLFLKNHLCNGSEYTTLLELLLRRFMFGYLKSWKFHRYSWVGFLFFWDLDGFCMRIQQIHFN